VDKLYCRNCEENPEMVIPISKLLEGCKRKPQKIRLMETNVTGVLQCPRCNTLYKIHKVLLPNQTRKTTLLGEINPYVFVNN